MAEGPPGSNGNGTRFWIVTASLQELERQRCAAIDASDWDRLGALLAADYTHTHANGLFDGSREQYLARMRGRRSQGAFRTTRGDLVVRTRGEVAIVTGPFHATFTPREGPRRAVTAAGTGVWSRAGASWELVSFQVTPVVDGNVAQIVGDDEA
jgi:ketosteroid isomerase-like protein